MKIPKVSLPRVKITPLAVKSIVTAYFHNYRNRPIEQEKFLLSHIQKNALCEFGKRHHLQEVRSVEEFQKAIPVQDYDTLYPRIERCLRGEKNILLRGSIERFATSS